MDQIAVIRPRVICTLGRFATKLLAETDLSITAIHGKAKERTLAGVHTVLFPVFHPAAALYTPANRQVLAEDFTKLRRLLELGVDALSQTTPVTASVSSVARAPSAAAGSSGTGVPPVRRPEPQRTEQLPLW